MNHETKKIALIVDEVLTMLLVDGSEKINFDISIKNDRAEINIIQYDTRYNDEYLEIIRNRLDAPRQHEIEEYYWQLTGENETEDELFIVGALIDESTLKKENGNLYINLVRYKW